MPPAAVMNAMHHPDEHIEDSLSLAEMASSEIETMRTADAQVKFSQFPPACLALLRDIEGNQNCIDCGSHDPQWATVSYGALLCLQCSGHHRSLGVQVSCVRSVAMDEWSLQEVVAMLEGGNRQLSTFYKRHALSKDGCKTGSLINPENVTRMRYKTKAAEFYRQQMEKHVCQVLKDGPYKGREMSRRKSTNCTNH